jgi:hypothetical protein
MSRVSKPAKTLYSSLIADLLNEANLREGTQGAGWCHSSEYGLILRRIR